MKGDIFLFFVFFIEMTIWKQTRIASRERYAQNASSLTHVQALAVCDLTYSNSIFLQIKMYRESRVKSCDKYISVVCVSRRNEITVRFERLLLHPPFEIARALHIARKVFREETSSICSRFVEFDVDKAVERKFTKFPRIFRLVFELTKLDTFLC